MSDISASPGSQAVPEAWQQSRAAGDLAPISAASGRQPCPAQASLSFDCGAQTWQASLLEMEGEPGEKSALDPTAAALPGARSTTARKPFAFPPEPGAPRAVPSFVAMPWTLRHEIPHEVKGRPVMQIDVNDDVDLQVAISLSREVDPPLTPVYLVDSTQRLAHFLAEGEFDIAPSGLVRNVFVPDKRRHIGDSPSNPDAAGARRSQAADGYVSVQLQRDQAGPQFLTRLVFDAQAPRPYRTRDDRWEAPASASEASAYFAKVFGPADEDGNVPVPRSPLLPSERRLFEPGLSPESIAIGPHTSFAKIYPSREAAHAAFGELVGSIAAATLVPGAGPLADEPISEYGAHVVPHFQGDGIEGYRLTPPVASTHQASGFASTDRMSRTLTADEKTELEAHDRTPDVAHTHPKFATTYAGHYNALTANDSLSEGDLYYFFHHAARDPEFALSVYMPGTKATQIITLSDRARRDFEAVSSELKWAAENKSAHLIGIRPEWFELTGVRVSADGTVRRTDWLQTMQEAESPDVRAVAEQIRKTYRWGSPTPFDLIFEDAVGKAARALDRRSR
jgi:hypothetical protein